MIPSELHGMLQHPIFVEALIVQQHNLCFYPEGYQPECPHCDAVNAMACCQDYTMWPIYCEEAFAKAAALNAPEATFCSFCVRGINMVHGGDICCLSCRLSLGVKCKCSFCECKEMPYVNPLTNKAAHLCKNCHQGRCC